MTSEFDTRIIKTFTAYHSMHVKVLLIAFDLQCSFYTGLYSKGICNCTDLYAEGEGSADQSASLALPVTQARLKIASSSQVEQKKG